MGAIDVNCQVYDNWDWLNKSWSNPKELLKFWKEDQEEEELDEVRTTIFQICVFDPDFLNHEHLSQPHAKLLPCTSWAFARFPASEYVWRPVNRNDKATFPACGASWRGEGQDPSLKLAYYSILLLMFHAHPQNVWMKQPTDCLYLPDLLYLCIPGVVAARVWVVFTKQHQEQIFSSRKWILWSHLRRRNHCLVTDLSFFEVPTQEIFVTEKFVVMDVIQCKIGLDFFGRWFLQIKSSLLFDGLRYTPHALHSSPRGKKRHKKSGKWEIGSASDSNYWRCQNISSSQHFWWSWTQKTREPQVLTGFCCIGAFYSHKHPLKIACCNLHLHIALFRPTGVGETIYWHNLSGRKQWWKACISTSNSPVDMENIPKKITTGLGYIPGGLLRSSKNHQQYQVWQQFFHIVNVNVEAKGSVEIPAANFLGSLLCRYIGYNPKLTFQLLEIKKNLRLHEKN